MKSIGYILTVALIALSICGAAKAGDDGNPGEKQKIIDKCATTPCTADDLKKYEEIIIKEKQPSPDMKFLNEEAIGIEKKCASGSCTKDDLYKYKEIKGDLENLKDRFRFGIAIGFEIYKDQYINQAEVSGDDKMVRVSDSQNYNPCIWLETHYVWDGWDETKLKRTHSAPGIYIGMRLLGADTDMFNAFSIGGMWAFKRTALGDVPPKGQLADSINIGVGPLWHRTKVLADGIENGEPLPANYDEVKFDTKDELSWMIMVSVGF